VTEPFLDAPENPSRNALGAGLTLEKIEAAIAKSGYPLQTHVAHVLRDRGFGVSPEWSFIDRDTNDLRSMDLRASLRLYERGDQTRARPAIDLVIECKQSELPFVFFTGESLPWSARLPFIVGLKTDDFSVSTDTGDGSWTTDLQDALGLQSHSFSTTPPIAYTMSKCQRKGSEVILSGEETYSGIVLPLVNALHYLKVAEAPPSTAHYFDVHYAVALAVLDAPMLAFERGVATMSPWVRLLRHEAGQAKLGKNDRGQTLAVDVVHRDFLDTYISDHLLPAGRDFADKVLRHPEEVADCRGHIRGPENARASDYEQHLGPKPTVPFLGRKGVRAPITGQPPKTVF